MINTYLSPEATLGLTHAHVVPVFGDKDKASHFLHPQALQAFLALQSAAKADGIDCQLVSSFRDFSRQPVIWDRKWSGELAVLDDDQYHIDIHALDKLARVHAIMRWSALPGASRHHWGTDIDVYDKQRVIQQQHRLALVQSEYEGNGVCAELAQWLAQRAHEFDFYLPYAVDQGGIGCEPWHLSYAPIAKPTLMHYPLEYLSAMLIKHQICGVHTVITHLESLYLRYIAIES